MKANRASFHCLLLASAGAATMAGGEIPESELGAFHRPAAEQGACISLDGEAECG